MSFATGPSAPTWSASRTNTVAVIQGEIEISDDPKVILSTILGSCVAVCLWDPRAGIGGMNHFLLAQGGARNDVKYGVYAMEMLINRLLRAGAQRSAFQCKVFGGATLSGFGNEIGRANAAFARKFLSDEEIVCVAESLEGDQPRRIRFSPTTGKVQMLFVKPVDVAPLIPPRVASAADITLF
jgi:chemotaxis protein CheD